MSQENNVFLSCHFSNNTTAWRYIK